MKLSDAMVLGSTQVKFDPTVWLDNRCGCLIGMALYAIGYDVGSSIEAMEEWPWLLEWRDGPFEDDGVDLRFPMGRPPCFIFSEMANRIAGGVMTFQQAVDWVKANEPEEAVAREDSLTAEETLHEAGVGRNKQDG
jgi:hypothetical protein